MNNKQTKELLDKWAKSEDLKGWEIAKKDRDYRLSNYNRYLSIASFVRKETLKDVVAIVKKLQDKKKAKGSKIMKICNLIDGDVLLREIEGVLDVVEKRD